jgi:hypothetical protein
MVRLNNKMCENSNNLIIISKDITAADTTSCSSPNREKRNEMKKQWNNNLSQNRKIERRNALVPENSN